MDDVVAQSSSLRASQRTPTTPSAAIDDIPFLTRAPSQIHHDSTRLVTMRTASQSPTSSVQPSALRMFASLDFEIDRLRRAVVALPQAAHFLDRPLRPVPPFHHPSWLAPRAVNDARLLLHAALRQASATSLRTDVDAATRAIIETVSNLYPPDPDPDLSMLSSSALERQYTERTPRAQPPGMSVYGGQAGGQQYAPPIAAAPLPEPYVAAIAEIATNKQAFSVAALVEEAALATSDAPHFIHMLHILAHTASMAPVAKAPPQDLCVWSARITLEDHFASRIPGLPDMVRLATPQAVIPAVESYVNSLFSQPVIDNSGGSRSGRNSESLGGKHAAQGSRPSIWPSVFYCLRIGAASAAVHLLQRTSSVPAQFFTWFLQGRETIEDAFQQMYFPQDDMDMLEDDSPTVAGCLTEQHMYEAVASEYRSAALSSDDAYMRACYVLLMRLELSSPASVADSDDVRHTSHGLSRRTTTAGGKHELYSLYLSDSDFEQVVPSVEDYLWLKLWLCRTACESEVVEKLPHSSFLTLNTIQSEITSFGAAHFDSDGTQPLLYAFILVATVQYEKAVRYLYEHGNEHWLHYALHLAVVLYHLQWLQSRDGWFERMLSRYVEQIARRNVTDAMLYVLTLRRKEEVVRLLRQVVVDSGEYEVIFGREDGFDGGGCVAAILATNLRETPSGFGLDDLKRIREDVASLGAGQAASGREFGRAAELYQLAGRPVDVIDMRVRDLADEVHKLWSGRRAGVLKCARTALQTCERGGSGEEENGRQLRCFSEWLNMLLAMSDVFEDYWTGRYAAAWSRLRDVDLVPMRGARISQCQRQTLVCSRAWSGGETRISECVIELVKVVMHVAEYGLDSGSVVPEAPAQSEGVAYGGMHGKRELERERKTLPRVPEIKSVCAFVALMKCEDETIEQRLIRIESLLTAM